MFNERNNLIKMWLTGLNNTPHDELYHYGESGYEHSVHVALLCKQHDLDPLFGLLHDIGKVPTCKKRIDNQGRERWSFFNHGEVGSLWLSDKDIMKLLDIDKEFVSNVKWHLTPFLKNNKVKYGHKRTWIRKQYYKCDKLGGTSPKGQPWESELKDMLKWSYDEVIEWCYTNRSKYLIDEGKMHFGSVPF